jgi:predicted acyltransferase
VGARLPSVDALRGLAVAGMIVVNNQGDGSHVYAPLAHAPWHGLTAADLVFPTFLLVAGASLALAPPQSASWPRVARRVVLLCALGLVVNGFPRYELATLRFPGVLQRIALTYLLAVVITRALPLGAQVAVAGALAGGYWWAMTHVAVPGVGAGVLTPTGNLAGYVDRMVFGPAHIYRAGAAGYDPEGLLSTLPATVTVLVGVWAGRWLGHHRDRWTAVAGLAVAAAAAGALAAAWDPGIPVNKRLWTPSFVMATAAVGLAALGALHGVWCLWRRAGALAPLVVMGRNAIVAYVGADLLSGALQQVGRPDSLYDRLYRGLFVPPFGPYGGSVAFGTAMAALWLGVLTLLWRRHVYVRL